MPRLDIYHHTVRKALQNDGWAITHDPLVLRWGETTLFADLGAELIAAETPTRKIAVEVKSFLMANIAELQKALGQYRMYERIMARTELDRMLYLAVSQEAFDTVFSQDIAKLLLADGDLKLIVFDEQKEAITSWLP
jgi:hypothetical protein